MRLRKTRLALCTLISGSSHKIIEQLCQDVQATSLTIVKFGKEQQVNLSHPSHDRYLIGRRTQRKIALRGVDVRAVQFRIQRWTTVRRQALHQHSQIQRPLYNISLQTRQMIQLLNHEGARGWRIKTSELQEIFYGNHLQNQRPAHHESARSPCSVARRTALCTMGIK